MDAPAPVQPATVDVGDFSELLPHWRQHLRAANRAASTVPRYEKDDRAFLTLPLSAATCPPPARP